MDLVLTDATKKYNVGKPTEQTALYGVSLEIRGGESVAVCGAADSGKATLLRLLGCIELPTAGVCELDGKNVASYGEKKLARIRNEGFGFIMRDFPLVPELSVYENVTVPAVLGRVKLKNLKQRADMLLSEVGMLELRDKKAKDLSGGETRRACVARALINSPRIIIAEEPSAGLDPVSTARVFELLKAQNEQGVTVIATLRDPALSVNFRRVITLADGRLK